MILLESKGRSTRVLSIGRLRGMGARRMIIILGPKGLNLIKQNSAFSSERLFAFKCILNLLYFIFRS